MATVADHDVYERRLRLLDQGENPPLPEGWTDPEGRHLCWSECGGECPEPDWWWDVTPLEVSRMRTKIAELRAALEQAQEDWLGCESPPAGCDCPGCSLARERAEVTRG
jgi:hypothetical protein